MSKYNQSVLTTAGVALAKKAAAGDAKFAITRVASSAVDLSDKSIEELREVSELPNIMQYGKLLDAKDVESDNVVIGISCRFTNEGLKDTYDVNTVGIYAKEDGTDQDFLFAIATAKNAEHMPDFSDLVLYRFSLNFYVVVGESANVTVWVDDKTVVSAKTFEKFKADNKQQFADFKKQIDDAKKEFQQGLADAGKVETVSVDGGNKIQPVNKNINLALKDKYVSQNELIAKLPNFKFATEFNPVTNKITIDVNKYNSHTIVTPEGLRAIAEKVNEAYEKTQTIEKTQTLFKEFSTQTEADTWIAEANPGQLRIAHVVTN